MCPSPPVLWVSHIPSTSALTHTQGCDSPAGGCPDLCLGRLLTRGPLLLPLPTHAHPRRLQGAGNAVATAASSPTSRGPAPLPSPRSCAARPRSSTPAEGTFVSRGTFCLLPSSASRGDRPPPETKAAASAEAAAAGGASREAAQASDTHTPPHARKCPGDRGPKWTRGATNTSEPLRRAVLLNLPAGPEPPAPAPSPKHPPAALSPGSAGQQGKPRAAASRQLTSKCGDRVPRAGEARRTRKAAPPTPAATGCRSRSQRLADPRRLRGAGLRRRSSLPAHAEGPSLREGPPVPHALSSPPDNMAPGLPSRAGGPLIPLEEPQRE